MKREGILSIFIIILAFFMIQTIGCGTAESVYETGARTAKSVYQTGVGTAKSAYGKVTGNHGSGDKSLLKKKILLLPIMDQAGIGEAKIEQMTAKLAELLNEDEHLMVHKAAMSMKPTSKGRSSQFGIVIDPELAQITEEMGMNILITAILTPFEVHSKKTGMWPVAKIKREIEISMVVNVLDITNGTLFLTNLESKRIKIDEDEMEIREGGMELDNLVLDKELFPILEDHALAVRDVLEDEPWTGRLLSADNNAIMINAGEDVGITEDRVFDVFAAGDSIRSASGQMLHLLGPKIGEIKVSEVMRNYSSAVPLSGDGFKAGYVIKMKD